MIPPEREAEILRLHHAEHWPVGTIARQLGLHHQVVRRVLAQAGQHPRHRRPSQVEPYLPFLQETLAKYPRLRASRLWQMIRARGYPGNKDYFRAIVARLRPKPPAEAFLRLRTLMGEQAQVDWAHFGKVTVGRAERQLLAFVMVLSYSRRIFLRFYLGGAMPNFLRGHVDAFQTFGGCARTLLYDNLKSAVLERVRDAIRFHPTLLALSSHYRFEPRPVAPFRGNEKGRVERAIQYVRSAFFAARTWADLDDLNAQAAAWCASEAMDRPWPDDRRRTVRDACMDEASHLLPLPAVAFPTDEQVVVRLGKTPYARFDGNDYSVPPTYVRRTLTVVASLDVVRVLDGATVVATHPRTFDKGAQLEDPAHIEALVATKRQAHEHRGMDRLHHALLAADAFFEAVAARGGNLGATTNGLTRLLDRYGALALDEALQAAIAADAAHLPAVHRALERHRQGLPPPVPVPLPDDPRLRGLVVRPHALEMYTQLLERN
jgi:transposase